jgi:hypothetical protein
MRRGFNMISIKDLMKKLNIDNYPERWNQIYPEAMKEYEEKGAFFTDEKYIIDLNEKYTLFTDWFDTILSAAMQVRKTPDLLKYAFLLHYALKDRNEFPAEIKNIVAPRASENEKDILAYDFLLVFPLLPTIPKTARAYEDRGVPEEIIMDTLKTYEGTINSTKDLYGEPGFSFRYLSWLQLYIDAVILKIGRLNFNVSEEFKGCVRVFKSEDGEIQMLMTDVRLHKGGMAFGSPGYNDENLSYDANFCETNEYYEGYPVGDKGLFNEERIRLSKAKWKAVFSPGDSAIGVHIPAAKYTGRLTKDACESAYAIAKTIFPRCYPEYKFKAFTCSSWMMDYQLRQFLSEDSGIVQFQKKYMLYPRLASGRAIFSFLFKKPSYNEVGRLEDLPESTSLLKALKYHYIDGKYIYEQGGLFLLEDHI